MRDLPFNWLFVIRCWWTQYIWYIIHKFLRHERSVSSETILISNPCFQYIFFLSFSIRNFFFDRWQMCVHNLLKPVGWVHQEQRWSKRAPDLAWFSTYSLFGPLRFSSFVYILARLYLSISVQLQWVWRRIAEQPSTPLLSTLQKVKTKRRQVSTFQVNSLKSRTPMTHDFQAILWEWNAERCEESTICRKPAKI